MYKSRPQGLQPAQKHLQEKTLCGLQPRFDGHSFFFLAFCLSALTAFVQAKRLLEVLPEDVSQI
jgi:hypothetical protein